MLVSTETPLHEEGGWRDYAFLSGVRSIMNITGTKVYVINDKIMLCAKNAKSVGSFDPAVAIGIRDSG
jgi:hypothetical protein